VKLWSSLQDWVVKNTGEALTVAGGTFAALVALLVLLVLILLKRQRKNADKPKDDDDDADSRKINALITLGTIIGTGVQATGMWKFFEKVLGLPVLWRVAMFPFLEILLLAVALRARRKARKGGAFPFAQAGMVVLLGFSSGLMSATDASSFKEAAFRIVVALVLVALWLVELWDLWKEAREEASKAAGDKPKEAEAIRWRFNLREVGVRLGLATANDSTLADLDASRHMERYLRVVDKRKALERLLVNDEDNAKLRASLAKISTEEAEAKGKLERHARLHADPTALMAELGAAAVNQARESLGIAQAQQALKDANAGAAKLAAEIERLNAVAEAERKAAAEKHAEEIAKLNAAAKSEREAAATKAAAEIERIIAAAKSEREAIAAKHAAEMERLDQLLKNDRTGLGQELAKIRKQAEELETELRGLKEKHRKTADDLQAERTQTQGLMYRDELRENELKKINNELTKAQERTAFLEAELVKARATSAAAGLPAQRSAAANGSAPRVVEARISTGGDGTKKADYFRAADEHTENGTNVAHPLLDADGRTRNAAAQKIFEALGFPVDGKSAMATIRKYAQQYREARLSGDTSTGAPDYADDTADAEELALIDN